MPYDSIDAAKTAGFPISAEGVDLTLAQINKLAEIYDAIKKAGTADNPMAAAWTQWKKLYKKSGAGWVELAGDAQNQPPEGMEAATLSFGSPSKVTDDPNGDTIFHDVTLIAEGTWTDGYSKQATHYMGADLEKMRFEKVTMKMDHDIFGTLPLTNEIGVIENTRYIPAPLAQWVGDVRIFPTQNGKDTATLLKRGKVTDISSELFLKPVTNSKTKSVRATDMVFMGAATVRQGACTVCKFNEGINMTEETDPTPPAEGGGTTDPGLSGDPDVAALEAAVKEKELAKAAHTAEELKLAHNTIAELNAKNATLEARLLALEKDTRVKELQKKLDVMASTPVVHTVVAGGLAGAAPAQAVELDSGNFEAYGALDFAED